MSDEMTDPRGRFLASLNHEVRTPLSGILGMTDLLLETRLDEEQRDYVQSARICAENLLELLNATLEYSALSSDGVVLDESEFTLLELLTNIANEFEFKARAKGLRLIRTFSQNLPEMARGDALRLRQILSHLMANAVKFTHRGHVEIGASAEPLKKGEFSLRLSVSDTGIGIPADHLHSVFESFRQLDAGLSRRYTGLGLGLSLAQKITSLMNGNLDVVSEVGAGSRFQVDIPLRAAAEHRVSRTEEAISTRILLVEDNPVAQTIAAQILRRRGFEVDCASSGKDALTSVRTIVYELILMDLQLPDMDGFQTVARIRDLGPYATVPILALTANASSDCRDACARNGLNGFLTKPVRPQELIAAIERHLSRKRMPVGIATHPDFVKPVAQVS
jgi:CheY-like chemotaxis protein/anti-sigma regulatory factor (Ser/Thr protein kinase)